MTSNGESVSSDTACIECGAAPGTQCHPFCLLSTDIIHIYTRGDALRDGVLIDITETAREAGFSCPVAITAAAWLDFVKWAEENRACQDEAGRLWDVLTMARHAARGSGNRSTFRVLRVPNTPRTC